MTKNEEAAPADETASVGEQGKRGERARFGAIKLADMLIPRLKNRFRYNAELGWLHHTGAKWAQVGDEPVLHNLVQVLKWYSDKIISEKGPSSEVFKELAIMSSGSVQMHAIRIARAHPAVYTPWDLFDARPDAALKEPYLLHCANAWTIELYRDGNWKARETTPADLNTKVACEYDPDAEPQLAFEVWDKYQPDPEVLRFQMELAIRGLSGMGVERFIAWYGETGGNGKGTIEGLLTAIAGEYALKIPIEMLLARRGGINSDQFRNEKAQMRGARLVFADEPENGVRFAVGDIKALTGGSPITAREIYRKPITFTPHILLTMIANNRPRWEPDGGMERRYIEINWPYQVKESELRESFKDELLSEAPGVLNVLLSMWPGDTPVIVPDAVKKQTEVAKRESNPYAKFFDEAIEQKPGNFILTGDMYDAYCGWCLQNGERARSSTALGTALRKLGVEKGRNQAGKRGWFGVAIDDDYRPRGKI